MQEPSSTSPWRSIAVRDRRYSIRYPFAAEAELLDLESGMTASGVASDLSIAGARRFVEAAQRSRGGGQRKAEHFGVLQHFAQILTHEVDIEACSVARFVLVSIP